MTNQPIPLLLAAFFLLLTACNEKEEAGDNWISCSGCSLDSWVGTYSGKADYFDAALMKEIAGLDISVVFEETATNYLTAYITVPGHYSASVSGEWNSPYSISFAGSSTSLDGTLYMRDMGGGELRFSGNSKRFHFKVDSLVVDELVTFDVYK